MHLQFFSTCCGQQPTSPSFPFKSPRSQQLTKARSSNRLSIFSPKNDYGLFKKDPIHLTSQQKQLKNLIHYENSLKHQIRQIDRFYQRQVKPLEEQCQQYKQLNNERNRQIMNVNTRLRAVQNGYVNYN